MAEAYGVSVSGLLPDHIDRLTAGVEQHLLDQPGALAKLGGGWIASRVAAQVKSLDIDPFELIAKAWATARELHGYADAKLHPPGRTETMWLGEHTLTAAVNPVFQFTVAGVKLPEMRFSLVLTAALRSASLSIRDGALIAAAAGDASATAVLKYRDVDLHDPLPLRTLRLPGHKDFDPPLRIP